MKKTQLSIVALLALAVAPAITFAQEEYSGDWKYSLGADGFFGLATKDIFDGLNEKIDIGGANFRFSARNDSLFDNSAIMPEFFAVLGFGGGSYDKTTDYYHYSYGHVSHEKEEMDVYQTQISVGANIRWQANEAFALFAGARIGLGVTRAEYDYKYDNYQFREHESGSKSDTAVGFLYGIGLGAEYAFNEHHAITLGYDFIGSTAKPEFSDDGETVKANAQRYHVFSLGYKYTF